MDGMATITSKRQFTIPVHLFKKAGYKPQQKMLVRLLDAQKGIISITPMSELIEELVGSVKIAPEYKGLSLNEMVEKGREDYYKDYSK